MPQAPPPPAGTKAPDGATPRMGQHQGWGGSPQRQDSATSGLERRNQKTERRNVRDGAVQPKKRNRATSELERRNPKNGTSQCQGWSGATQKNEIARHQSWSGATSGTKQRNPIDRTAQPSRSSVSFEAGNQRPGRRFGHTHGAICREKAQAARACKGSCGRNLTAH